MAEQCAVIGVGQTHHKKRRDDVSIPGLLREAATRALEDAECLEDRDPLRGGRELRDLDATVHGAQGRDPPGVEGGEIALLQPADRADRPGGLPPVDRVGTLLGDPP